MYNLQLSRDWSLVSDRYKSTHIYPRFGGDSSLINDKYQVLNKLIIIDFAVRITELRRSNALHVRLTQAYAVVMRCLNEYLGLY